jgi:formate dehydrogenase subunit delta
MANQIAANFAHHPADQAASEVAAHIKSFWTPAMREDLRAWLDDGGDEVHPIAVEAFERLRPPAG